MSRGRFAPEIFARRLTVSVVNILGLDDADPDDEDRAAKTGGMVVPNQGSRR